MPEDPANADGMYVGDEVVLGAQGLERYGRNGHEDGEASGLGTIDRST